MWKRLLALLAIVRIRQGVRAHSPLALHHLYEVHDEDDEIVISLRGHDLDGDEVRVLAVLSLKIEQLDLREHAVFFTLVILSLLHLLTSLSLSFSLLTTLVSHRREQQ